MPEPTDQLPNDSTDLLLFASHRDQAALARVIRRHADFVYACCLRQLRDPALADDAAQAVFILLAKKAGTIRGGPLVGWLFNVARHASRNALRAQRRRRHHEKEAALPANAAVAPSPLTGQIDPRLDEALSRLSDKDRQVVLLRYFNDQTHGQIAAAMGTTAHTAKMRLYRALEKLRARLQRDDTNLTPALFETALAAAGNAAKIPAPLGFADRATSAAAGLHANTAAAAIATAVAATLALRKLCAIAGATAVLLAIAGGAILAVQHLPAATTRSNNIAVTQPAIDPQWRTSFDAVYTLSDGEDLRRIHQPYVPTRSDFQQLYYHPRPYNGRGNGPIGSKSVGNTTDPPDAMDLEWDPTTRRVERITRINWGAWAFESLTVNLVGLHPDQFTMPAKMTGITLAGDWVFRKGATPQQRLESFQKQLQNTPAAFVFEKKSLDRKVIVIQGAYHPADFPTGKITLQWTPAAPQRVTQGGDVGYFIRHLTMALGRPLLNEWTGSDHAYLEFPSTIFLKFKQLPADQQDAHLAEILAPLAQQMHAQLIPQTRQIETFVISPSPNKATSNPNPKQL